MKRSQATIFIILGIVVVLIVGLVAYYQTSIKKVGEEEEVEMITLSQDARVVQEVVDECVKTVSADAVYIAAFQGGYITLPNTYLSTETADVAYGYYKGKNILPTFETVMGEVASYVEDTLPVCANFEQFPNLEVTTAFPNAQADADTLEVMVNVDYDIKVKKGGSEEKLKAKYSATIPATLATLYTISDEIVEAAVKNPDNIPLSDLLATGMDIDIYPYKEGVLIYSIKDDGSKINNEPLKFMFAMER